MRVDQRDSDWEFTRHSFLRESNCVYCEKFMQSSHSKIEFDVRDSQISFRSRFLRLMKLFQLWNWKAAVFSVMMRAPVFAIVAIKRGPVVIVGVVLTEAAVCALNAGTYSAVVQVLRNRKPVWLVAAIVTVVLPVCGQVVEYFVHLWHGTPHTTAAVIISSVIGAISYLFNWYAMKQGTLLVGGEHSSLGADLKRIPMLLYNFFLLGPRWLGRRLAEPAVPSR
jgi:hypothetical protein